jgi:acyl-coenzyme A synthetase/AMP-(fatty) acid ligase
MQATPATWRLLIEAGFHGGASFTALCGGEALTPELADALAARCGALWNMYGPTETTVWSTCGRVVPGEPISIGRPIANTKIWILDERGALAPIGVPGEIWIGGEGVALDYHARPDLTAERFVADPFSTRSGARMYRTGDRGRYREGGKIVHLGRADQQVKVRGYRIELGEIEAVLAAHPSVAQAVVDARPGPGGEKRLVAYVVARSGQPNVGELREHARASLPDYMVPSAFVTIERVPLTPNGKVDRRALPEPTTTSVASSGSLVLPRTESEKIVAAVWRELLSLDQVAASDSFLDLGGHSLLIMRAIAMLEAKTGKRVSPRSFVFNTLEQIAREYDRTPDEPATPEPPPRISGVISRLFAALTKG